MKYDDIRKKAEEYIWLKGIADKYRKMISYIESEEKYFRVEKITYSARGDSTEFELNLHRTIPSKYIIDGLKDILPKIENEMIEIKKSLDYNGVQID